MQAAVVTGTAVVLPGIKDAGDLLGPAPAGSGHTEAQRLPAGKGLRYKDRATLLALAAAHAALSDAGLLGEDGLEVPHESVGTVVSSNLGNLDTVCQVAERLQRHGPAGMSALDLPNASSNVIASSVAIRFGLRGVNLTLCNGATSGLDAVGWATLAIAAGRVKRVVVIGVEPANTVVETLAGPGQAARLLDGAGALVLESATAAAHRRRTPAATVAGYARRRDARSAAHAAGSTGTIGLWLPAPADGTPPTPPHGPPPAAVCDLGRTLAPASGALGVLQCAAATAWLTAPHPHPGTPPTALATTGGGVKDDACAAVLLTD
jgi:3-oxoacyl-[acyl-carrier-protein] synthase II